MSIKDEPLARLKRNGAIDGLRGVAILIVMAVHASQRIAGLGDHVTTLANQGARGVQLFYVLSAVTLCLVWEARGDGAFRFYLRRLFRIAPMYWIAIFVFLAIYGTAPRYFAPKGIGFGDILANIFFVHEFVPNAITSVVDGGWTIANEMTFYAIFPLLFMLLSTWRRCLVAVIASGWFSQWLYPHAVVIANTHFSGTEAFLLTQYVFLWLPNHIAGFFVGMLVYRLLTEIEHLPRWTAISLLGLSFAALPVLPFIVDSAQIILVYSIAFGFLVYAAIAVGGNAFPAALQRVGRVSYSAYLWHFILIALYRKYVGEQFAAGLPLQSYGIFYAGLAFATLGLSQLTFRFVETPMIRLGASLTDRREKPTDRTEDFAVRASKL